MNERVQIEPAPTAIPQGDPGLFDAAPDVPLPVTVSSGPYAEQLPVGNMSVGTIRRQFADRLDLAPNTQAILDGREVGDDVVVRPGQALLFIRHGGEKGATP